MSSFLRMLCLGAICMVLATACGSDDGPGNINDPNNNNSNTSGNVDLYMWYWNPDGNNPQVQLLDSLNVLDVSVNTPYAANAGNSEVAVILDNLRISDATGGQYEFEASDITVKELRNGSWIQDSEFRVEREKIEDLDVVLVLDASNSLEDRFSVIQSQAINFANKIYENSTGSEVAIVPFATDVMSPFPLSSEEESNDLALFVNSIEQDQFTALYDGMAQGVQILKSNSAASKAMVTFTDGNDNNSQPDNNLFSIRQSLQSFSADSVLITSFTIGLFDAGSSLDTTTLNSLALNGGTSEITSNVNDINTIFEDFSETIAKAHSISYIRNSQTIPVANRILLHFNIDAQN